MEPQAEHSDKSSRQIDQHLTSRHVMRQKSSLVLFFNPLFAALMFFLECETFFLGTLAHKNGGMSSRRDSREKEGKSDDNEGEEVDGACATREDERVEELEEASHGVDHEERRVGRKERREKKGVFKERFVN